MLSARAPQVSVCIPTFNGARYLDACLRSVRRQTLQDLEILVVDDGSSDDTISIIRRHAEEDRRVRPEADPHRRGLVNNWNRCVALARAGWIKFVFQDDLIDPSCVERLLEAGTDTGAGLIGSFRRIVFDDVDQATRDIYAEYAGEESLGGVFPGRTVVTGAEFCHALLDHLMKNFVGEPTAILLHRTVFERFGYFDPRLVSMSDLEYWARVATNTGMAIVPDTLATFRVHATAASAVNRQEQTYRLKHIDPLILLHEFAFGAAFTSLRAVAASRRPPVDLPALFARTALAARRLAVRRAARLGHDDWLREWRAIAEHIPRTEKAFIVRRMRFLRSIGWYRARRVLSQMR